MCSSVRVRVRVCMCGARARVLVYARAYMRYLTCAYERKRMHTHSHRISTAAAPQLHLARRIQTRQGDAGGAQLGEVRGVRKDRGSGKKQAGTGNLERAGAWAPVFGWAWGAS